jgi:hypothetical protein
LALAARAAINVGMNDVCGAITRRGGRCQNSRGAACPYHTDEERTRAAAEPEHRPDPESGGGELSPGRDAIAKRDLHAVAWRLLEDLLEDDRVDAARRASAGATLIRVVEALGEPPVSRERAAAEIALRGMVMHGMPPRNAEEWALAEELFTPDAVAMFRTWEPGGDDAF